MTDLCLGHDPHPQPPRTKAPAGACDCHAHVIEPPEVLPYVANRAYTPPPASLAAYKSMHEVLGIERAVIVQPSVYGTDNSVTLKAIQEYGSECRGIAVVDETVMDRELEWMHESGMRGIRFNMIYSGGADLNLLERLADRIKALGWHVQLLINGAGLLEVETRLRKLPVPTVIDHMGHIDVSYGLEQRGFQALLWLVRDGISWVKLSGNYRLSRMRPRFEDVVPFARSLIEAAPDRMIWGTDWPHPAMTDFMPNDGDLLDALSAYAPEPDLRRAILTDNPARLYGF